MGERDFYEVLGVARGAAEPEIKKAYRRIAFENHPDRNPGDKAAEERFKEATEAYEILKDPDQRARYDQFGHAAFGGGAAGGARGYDFSGFDLADALRAFMRDFGGDMGGFEDLFGAARRGGPRRGDDLRVRLRLSLEEILTGVEKKIRVKHLRPCETCKGKGGSGETICPTCQGNGQVRRVQHTIFGQFVNVTTCPACQGEGRTLREPCTDCQGDGRESRTETISVQVPAGVAGGNYIPLRGMGDAGIRGGPAGDLIVQIEEKRHDVFERDGNDLHVDVPVSFATLALGAAIEVPVLDGGAAPLNVPAGTQSGHVMRLRGKGLPALRGGKGDLYARLHVWVPGKLSGEDRKRLAAIEKGGGLKPPRPSRSLFERVKDAFAG